MTDSGNIMNFHFFYKVAKTIRCLLKFTNEDFITDEWLQFCSPKIFLVLNTRKDTGILARRNSIKREGEINIELHKLSICWGSLPLPSHISHFDSFKLGDKTWGKNHLEAIIGSAQGVQHFWLLRSGRGVYFHHHEDIVICVAAVLWEDLPSPIVLTNMRSSLEPHSSATRGKHIQ